MTAASIAEIMSPKLLKVAELARKDPQARFGALAYLIDEAALARSFDRLERGAAVGLDGISKDQYGQNLGENLRELHARMKAGKYRHQPIRRVHIPKAPGQTRPIGISSIEDKIVQGALREVLQAIYEQDFIESSFGFRPGRSAHDALRALNRAVWREGASSSSRCSKSGSPMGRFCDSLASVFMWACWTARNSRRRRPERHRAQACRRCLGISIFITCWTFGSSGR